MERKMLKRPVRGKVFVSLVLTIATISMCVSPSAAAWQSMVSGTTETLRDVWGTASNNIYAVGHSGTILHYDGDGDNDGSPDQIWEQMNSQTTVEINGIWGSGLDDIWAVGQYGMILHTQNGSSWQKMSGISGDIHLNGVWGVNSSDVYAVGQYLSGHGAILHWNGNAWNNDIGPVIGPLGQDMQFNNLWGRGSNEIFVFGHNGISSGLEGVCYIYDGDYWHWEWSGTGWPKTRSLRAMWGTSDELFIPAERFGGPSDWCAQILHYSEGTWQMETLTDINWLEGVWGSSSDNIYIVGTQGKIVHYEGTIWSEMNSGTMNNLNAV